MTEQNNETPKLYAGKFKTVEELEAGYKNSLPTFQENEQLKGKLEEATKIPDQYMNPTDVELDANKFTALQAKAKAAGMNQAQYEKYVRNEKAIQVQNQQNFENARKEIGEQDLNLLKDYVNKNFPTYSEAMKENLLNTFVVNKEARASALNHRTQLLNNQVPGMNKTPAVGYSVTQEDIDKAYAAKTKNPHDMKLRNNYIRLLEAKAAQRNAS
jgi:hypothetical protein